MAKQETVNPTTICEEIHSRIYRMEMELEEIFALLAQRPKLGNRDVAENLVTIENLLPLIRKKIRENEND